jgi:hypothetical protein
MNPQLPADVFTACLTTPIKMALHWYCQHTLIKDVNTDLIDKLPGRLNDRRTALGELNWYVGAALWHRYVTCINDSLYTMKTTGFSQR